MAPFNRILLCYDPAIEGRRALRSGALLAQQLDAETHLLSISDFAWWSNGFDVLSPVKFDADKQAATDILREGIDALRAWGVTARGHFALGMAVDQIPRVANTMKVDLIIIGHRRGGTVARWWAAGNHILLLNRVSCSILFQTEQ